MLFFIIQGFLERQSFFCSRAICRCMRFCILMLMLESWQVFKQSIHLVCGTTRLGSIRQEIIWPIDYGLALLVANPFCLNPHASTRRPQILLLQILIQLCVDASVECASTVTPSSAVQTPTVGYLKYVPPRVTLPIDLLRH